MIFRWFMCRTSPANSPLSTSKDNPEPWDFSKQQSANIVVINIGTNDNNSANNVSSAAYVNAYTKLIQGVHGKYPKAQVVVMVRFQLPLYLLLYSALGVLSVISRSYLSVTLY
jgi:hypothetical protein